MHTPLEIFQQPQVKEQSYNYFNISPVADEYICSIRIYLNRKKGRFFLGGGV